MLWGYRRRQDTSSTWFLRAIRLRCPVGQRLASAHVHDREHRPSGAQLLPIGTAIEPLGHRPATPRTTATARPLLGMAWASPGATPRKGPRLCRSCRGRQPQPPGSSDAGRRTPVATNLRQVHGSIHRPSHHQHSRFAQQLLSVLAQVVELIRSSACPCPPTPLTTGHAPLLASSVAVPAPAAEPPCLSIVLARRVASGEASK